MPMRVSAATSKWGRRHPIPLMLLNAERNSKTSCWRGCGLDPEDALQSHALIHLRDEYCDRNRCLDCRFGHYLLRHHARGRLFDWKASRKTLSFKSPTEWRSCNEPLAHISENLCLNIWKLCKINLNLRSRLESKKTCLDMRAKGYGRESSSYSLTDAQESDSDFF